MKNILNIKSYSISSNLITNEMLIAYIENFWNDVFIPLNENNNNQIHLLLMCKVHFLDSSLGYRVIGQLRKVNFSDKNLFNEYLISRLGLLSDAYTSYPIDRISFTYVIKAGEASGDRALLLNNLNNDKVTFHRFNNYNIPVSMNPSDYGKIIVSNTIKEES